MPDLAAGFSSMRRAKVSRVSRVRELGNKTPLRRSSRPRLHALAPRGNRTKSHPPRSPFRRQSPENGADLRQWNDTAVMIVTRVALGYARWLLRLGDDRSHYRRSACTRRHRISAAPSPIVRSPWSIPMPGSQPRTQTAKTCSGVPAPPQRRTDPSMQATPTSEQIRGDARPGSPGRGGRTAAPKAVGSIRQSCRPPASASPVATRPSTAQPCPQIATVSQGQAHSFRPSFIDPHG